MIDAGLTTRDTATRSRAERASRQRWLWVALVVVGILLPWLSYDWHTHRHSG